MILSTFDAVVESITAGGRLTMGELAAMVTARADFTREQVEFKVSRDTILRIGTRISVTVEVEG